MNFLKKAYYKHKYQPGAVISHFVAHDIKLEIIVIDSSSVENGSLIVRGRIIDCISLAKNKDYKIPEFSEPKRVNLAELWKWDVKIIRINGK